MIDLDATPLPREVDRIDWDLAEIERGGFAHFMLKEIFEQPQSVENAMRGRLILEDGTAKLGGLNLAHDDLLQIDNIIITACGTSWHAALIGELLIEELARIPVEVEYASEFRYRESDRHRAHAVHRDLAVRGDRRHAGGDARGEAPRRTDARVS